MEIRTKEITAKDMFNSSSALALKDKVGEELTVVGIFTREKTGMDGIEGLVGYVKTEDGIYATVSGTGIDQFEALAEMLEEGPCKIKVVARKSNAGREYFQLELV